MGEGSVPPRADGHVGGPRLQSWPTDMTIRPRMNSAFPDRKPPYPVYQAAWDNEYIWKGNLLTADGWLSRIVTGVAVSREDPAVLYVIDTLGDLYQSRDGAATVDGWRPIDSTPGSPALASTGAAQPRPGRRVLRHLATHPASPPVGPGTTSRPRRRRQAGRCPSRPGGPVRPLRHHLAGRVPQQGFRRGVPRQVVGGPQRRRPARHALGAVPGRAGPARPALRLRRQDALHAPAPGRRRVAPGGRPDRPGRAVDSLRLARRRPRQPRPRDRRSPIDQPQARGCRLGHPD